MPKQQPLPLPVELLGTQIYEADRVGTLPNRILLEVVTDESDRSDPCLSRAERDRFAQYVVEALNNYDKLKKRSSALLKALEAVVNDYEDTGCESCGTITEKTLDRCARVAKAK
jgi:hypothetical protein